MNWRKVIEYGIPMYFSGIYKIVSYKNVHTGKLEYQAYYLPPKYKNWGNYVDRKQQEGKSLTLAECKRLCEEHARDYLPTHGQADTALRWLEAHFPEPAAA